MIGGLPVVRTLQSLRATVKKWRRKGHRIALVPTMGALHEGHLSLIQIARKKASRVIVSVFVNPTQFGPNEDYDAYPRDEASDWEKIAKAKAHLLYTPSVSAIYPDDFSTRVEVIGLTSGLEGASRPRHFAGVTTVVTKLFLQCLPDIAVFGEKDYQQLLIIRQLVRDLDLPIDIVGGAIIREKDGLAMSSRNAHLDEHTRPIAPRFYGVLCEIAKDLGEGRPIQEVTFLGRDWLEGAGFKVDYLEVRDAENFMPVDNTVTVPSRLLGAVYLGPVRLIDNVPVDPASNR